MNIPRINSNINFHAFNTLSATFLVIFVTGCNYNDLKNTAPPAEKGDRGTFASVDFATVKTKVIDTACIRCHSGANPKGGIKLETYADVFPIAANIRTQVESGAMPPRPPGLSVEQKALLFAWVDSGAPEATVVTPPQEPPQEPSPEPTPTPTPTPPLPPPSPAIDFATVSREVFIPHCLKCHSNTTQKGHVNLEVYELAKSVTSEIATSLDTDDMPRRAPALPPELKAIVYKWIEGGAIEFVP